MFVIRSNQGQTVVRFSDSPISGHRLMSELHDYVASLAGSYSVEQEYDYDAQDDVYTVTYRDTETGKVYEVRNSSELEIVRTVTWVAGHVNVELV